MTDKCKLRLIGSCVIFYKPTGDDKGKFTEFEAAIKQFSFREYNPIHRGGLGREVVIDAHEVLPLAILDDIERAIVEDYKKSRESV
jgi:hypothetical protein